jgi:hypothetical protein
VSEKTKHVLSVSVFVAILLIMAVISFADGPAGWERLPILRKCPVDRWPDGVPMPPA